MDMFEEDLGEIRIGRLSIQFKLNQEDETCKIAVAGIVDGEMINTSVEAPYKFLSDAVIASNKAAELTFLKCLADVGDKPYREGTDNFEGEESD